MSDKFNLFEEDEKNKERKKAFANSKNNEEVSDSLEKSGQKYFSKQFDILLSSFNKGEQKEDLFNTDQDIEKESEIPQESLEDVKVEIKEKEVEEKEVEEIESFDTDLDDFDNEERYETEEDEFFADENDTDKELKREELLEDIKALNNINNEAEDRETVDPSMLGSQINDDFLSENYESKEKDGEFVNPFNEDVEEEKNEEEKEEKEKEEKEGRLDKVKGIIKNLFRGKSNKKEKEEDTDEDIDEETKQKDDEEKSDTTQRLGDLFDEDVLFEKENEVSNDGDDSRLVSESEIDNFFDGGFEEDEFLEDDELNEDLEPEIKFLDDSKEEEAIQKDDDLMNIIQDNFKKVEEEDSSSTDSQEGSDQYYDFSNFDNREEAYEDDKSEDSYKGGIDISSLSAIKHELRQYDEYKTKLGGEDPKSKKTGGKLDLSNLLADEVKETDETSKKRIVIEGFEKPISEDDEINLKKRKEAEKQKEMQERKEKVEKISLIEEEIMQEQKQYEEEKEEKLKTKGSLSFDEDEIAKEIIEKVDLEKLIIEEDGKEELKEDIVERQERQEIQEIQEIEEVENIQEETEQKEEIEQEETEEIKDKIEEHQEIQSEETELEQKIEEAQVDEIEDQETTVIKEEVDEISKDVAENLEKETEQNKKESEEKLEYERKISELENEKLKLEQEKIKLEQEKLRQEQEKIKHERLELERLEFEKLEAKRLELKRQEEELRENERIRLEKEREDEERLKRLREEELRIQNLKKEQEELEKERIENARLEKERLEQEEREKEELRKKYEEDKNKEELERLKQKKKEEELIAAKLRAERIESEKNERLLSTEQELEEIKIEAQMKQAQKREAEKLEKLRKKSLAREKDISSNLDIELTQDQNLSGILAEEISKTIAGTGVNDEADLNEKDSDLSSWAKSFTDDSDDYNFSTTEEKLNTETEQSTEDEFEEEYSFGKTSGELFENDEISVDGFEPIKNTKLKEDFVELAPEEFPKELVSYKDELTRKVNEGRTVKFDFGDDINIENDKTSDFTEYNSLSDEEVFEEGETGESFAILEKELSPESESIDYEAYEKEEVKAESESDVKNELEETDEEENEEVEEETDYGFQSYLSGEALNLSKGLGLYPEDEEEEIYEKEEIKAPIQSQDYEFNTQEEFKIDRPDEELELYDYDEIDYEVMLTENKLMSIDSIYNNKELLKDTKDTVFMIEVYSKTLPENLPVEVKRQSVLNIIKATNLDVDDLLTDAYNRIDVLNEILEDVALKSDEMNKDSEHKIMELESKIAELKADIQRRGGFQQNQNTMIGYEIQRIVNIVEFISPK